MCPELLRDITGRQMGTIASLAVQLLFIWIVTLIACYPVCDSIVILNVSAVIKILLALLVGGLGVWYISRYGFVNDMSVRTFLPSFDLTSLSYISVIIFNFLGFEVVCTFAGSMSEPKKQIPQSIVTGGIVIAAIYLFSAFGIGAAVDVREISVDSGLIDAVSLILGADGGVLVAVVALLFLVTLFGNMISWSMGVNSTAALAADHNDMPRIFAKRWAKTTCLSVRRSPRASLPRACAFWACSSRWLRRIPRSFGAFCAESCDAAVELSSRVPSVFEAAARRCKDAASLPRAGVRCGAALHRLCADGAHHHLYHLYRRAALV